MGLRSGRAELFHRYRRGLQASLEGIRMIDKQAELEIVSAEFFETLSKPIEVFLKKYPRIKGFAITKEDGVVFCDFFE